MVGEFVDSAEGWQIDHLTVRDIALVQPFYSSNRVIGPLYPMSIFKERALERILEMVSRERIHKYIIGEKSYLSKRELSCLLGVTFYLHVDTSSLRDDLDAVVDAVDEMMDVSPSQRNNHDSGNDQPYFVDELPGPIRSVDEFDYETRQILMWAIKKRHIRGLRWGGQVHVCFEDTQKSMFPDYFEHNFGCLREWDHTYGHVCTDIVPRKGRYMIPLGYRDPIYVEKDPILIVNRVPYRRNDAFGNAYTEFASYPEEVVDLAAAKFMELSQKEGFQERIKHASALIERYHEELHVEEIRAFSDREVHWFRKFIAEGSFRELKIEGKTFIYDDDRSIFERYAAEILKEEMRPNLRGRVVCMDLHRDGSLTPNALFRQLHPAE